MTHAWNALKCAVYIGSVLFLGYAVGALIGLVLDRVMVWKAIGVLNALIGLVAWHRQPQPGKLATWFAIKLSLAEGRLFVRTGWICATEFLFLLFAWELLAMFTGWVALWLYV